MHFLGLKETANYVAIQDSKNSAEEPRRVYNLSNLLQNHERKMLLVKARKGCMEDILIMFGNILSWTNSFSVRWFVMAAHNIL